MMEVGRQAGVAATPTHSPTGLTVATATNAAARMRRTVSTGLRTGTRYC